jgi:hypothetical protein
MSLFDFFFPEQAQASHLRTLAESSQSQATDRRRQRFADLQAGRLELARSRNLEERVVQLERELNQAGLAMAALLELLEQSAVASREALAARIQAIDLRDGVADGQITPPPQTPFKPNREWPGTSAEV